ncbi:MAG TPA: ABC-type transport auxiliary lipoprotein family protein, partial [Caulobacteraceae bacterium]|nr:ABC-type transport auxiliary lipoprotein family protein [Caulobacteraceae bacterium]
AQLFRFGDAPPPRSAIAPGAARFTVQIASLGFERAAAGDRILTVTGDEAAFIKGSRWLTGASTMFDEAVTRAFDADGGAARLVARGEASRIDYVVKLDVRVFEARYAADPKAAPTAVVEVYAAIGGAKDRTAIAERIFQAQAPASDNRVYAIAAAFDQAVGKVLGELVSWVDAKGAN